MDIFIGLIACIAAVFIGVFLAKQQARAFSSPSEGLDYPPPTGDGSLPLVNHFDYGDMRFLHLGSPAVQGSMKISKPYEIHLEYQQRMMAWLLFTDLDKVNQLHVMQLGLGAASLTKFCNITLGMKTTAIELNPDVIETCRRWFHLPGNNYNLQVIESDAAIVAQDSEWFGKIDVLQVDLYDQAAESPVLDTAIFYANCLRLLSPNGCMTVNVFGRQSHAKNSAKKIATSFREGSVFIFKPTKAGNSIIVALRAPQQLDKHLFSEKAKIIEARWPIPTKNWIKALSPITTH